MQNSVATSTMRATNNSYILTHGILGVEWAHDHHPPAETYDLVYVALERCGFACLCCR